MLRDSWRAYREGVAQNFKDVEHIPKCGMIPCHRLVRSLALLKN